MLKFWLAAMAYLAAVNIITVLAFFWDKRSAITGGWRIKESALLLLALLGGSVGGKYAQQMFRHKTQKQPFKAMLNIILVVQLIGLVALFLPGVRAEVVRLGKGIVAADWSLSKPDSEQKLPRRFGPGS